MHAVLRVVLLALGSLFVASNGHAQPAELPAIFAPRATQAATSSTARGSRPGAAALVSDRARSLIQAATVRVLEGAAIFDAPVAASSRGSFVDVATGATVMAPMIVKAESLTDSQVRPPIVRLFHFVPFGGDEARRVAGGATAPLYHAFIGKTEMQVDLSVLNLAGNGIDHNIDFTRVEIAVSFKW
jgi:hypothetical protein